MGLMRLPNFIQNLSIGIFSLPENISLLKNSLSKSSQQPPIEFLSIRSFLATQNEKLKEKKTVSHLIKCA
jgi:hypothetical protein